MYILKRALPVISNHVIKPYFNTVTPNIFITVIKFCLLLYERHCRKQNFISFEILLLLIQNSALDYLKTTNSQNPRILHDDMNFTLWRFMQIE